MKKRYYFVSLYLVLQEVLIGARLVKGMVFALLSGEVDQYVNFLPDIQGNNNYCVHQLYFIISVLFSTGFFTFMTVIEPNVGIDILDTPAAHNHSAWVVQPSWLVASFRHMFLLSLSSS